MVGYFSGLIAVKKGKVTFKDGRRVLQYVSTLRPLNGQTPLQLAIEMDAPVGSPLTRTTVAMVEGRLHYWNPPPHTHVLLKAFPSTGVSRCRTRGVRPKPVFDITGKMRRTDVEDNGSWRLKVEVQRADGELPWCIMCDMTRFPDSLRRDFNAAIRDGQNTLVHIKGTFQSVEVDTDGQTTLVIICPQSLSEVSHVGADRTFVPVIDIQRYTPPGDWPRPGRHAKPSKFSNPVVNAYTHTHAHADTGPGTTFSTAGRRATRSGASPKAKLTNDDLKSGDEKPKKGMAIERRLRQPYRCSWKYWWYHSESDTPIPYPIIDGKHQVGDVYIHAAQGDKQAWVWVEQGFWQVIEIMGAHPNTDNKYSDYVLYYSKTGDELLWIKKKSAATYKSAKRKELAKEEATKLVEGKGKKKVRDDNAFDMEIDENDAEAGEEGDEGDEGGDGVDDDEDEDM
ncbi:hypothetical protein FRB99_003192 [Tulasnella sp. 403]|nr:hypothetical protein FRB99_003192 [Tulasnella sp. 403]